MRICGHCYSNRRYTGDCRAGHRRDTVGCGNTIAYSTSFSDGIIDRSRRPPRLVIAAVPKDLSKYNRSNWYHRWSDPDGDCQDTRAEVLIAESMVEVSFGIDVRCTVDRGRWLTPFTGTTVDFARLLDIGHSVQLTNAHRSGGLKWSPQRKEAYLNDLLFDGHLIAVVLSVTRSGGASGREDWQPPGAGYRCEYTVNWIKVKAAWDLTATADE